LLIKTKTGACLSRRLSRLVELAQLADDRKRNAFIAPTLEQRPRGPSACGGFAPAHPRTGTAKRARGPRQPRSSVVSPPPGCSSRCVRPGRPRPRSAGASAATPDLLVLLRAAGARPEVRLDGSTPGRFHSLGSTRERVRRAQPLGHVREPILRRPWRVSSDRPHLRDPTRPPTRGRIWAYGRADDPPVQGMRWWLASVSRVAGTMAPNSAGPYTPQNFDPTEGA